MALRAVQHRNAFRSVRPDNPVQRLGGRYKEWISPIHGWSSVNSRIDDNTGASKMLAEAMMARPMQKPLQHSCIADFEAP